MIVKDEDGVEVSSLLSGPPQRVEYGSGGGMGLAILILAVGFIVLYLFK